MCLAVPKVEKSSSYLFFFPTSLSQLEPLTFQKQDPKELFKKTSPIVL